MQLALFFVCLCLMLRVATMRSGWTRLIVLVTALASFYTQYTRIATDTTAQWLAGISSSTTPQWIWLAASAFAAFASQLRKARVLGVTVGLSAAIGWLTAVGSYSPRRDDLLLCICTTGVIVIVAGQHRWRWLRPAATSRASGSILALSFWVLSSQTDAVTRTKNSAPVDITRFAGLWPQSPWRDLHVGVALSGGGYRAALMHAGVLDALEELRVNVTHISSVSGGAILASYYAIGGSPQQFVKQTIVGGPRFFREASRFPTAFKWLCPEDICGFTRTDLQAAILDHEFLNSVKASELGGVLRPSAAPLLMLNATDLNLAESVGMMALGVLTRRLASSQERYPFANEATPGTPINTVDYWPRRAHPHDQPLSRLVAAAGAFPVALAPVVMPLDGHRDLRLVDGGVADNTGVTALLDAADTCRNWSTDVVIASDAGASMNAEGTRSDQSSSGLRALDVVYSMGGLRHGATTTPMILLWPESPLKTVSLVDPDAGVMVDVDKINDKIRALPPEAFRALEQWMITYAFVPETPRMEPEPVFQMALAYRMNTLVRRFRSTRTLEDNVSPRAASELFALGRVLVFLNWADIKRSLTDQLNVVPAGRTYRFEQCGP